MKKSRYEIKGYTWYGHCCPHTAHSEVEYNHLLTGYSADSFLPLTAPQSSAWLSMPTSCERQANTEPFSDFLFAAETQMFCPGWPWTHSRKSSCLSIKLAMITNCASRDGFALSHRKHLKTTARGKNAWQETSSTWALFGAWIISVNAYKK